MDYGRIFTDTFKLLWHQKKLWVIALLGMVLMFPITGFYMGGMMWKQSKFMQSFMASPPDPAAFPQALGQWWLKFLPLILLASFLYILSYIINLFARGGGILEADLAWAGEEAHVRRGFRAGKGVAPGVFAIDLLWLLPEVLVVLLLLAAAGISLTGVLSVITKGDMVEGGDILRMFGGAFVGTLILIGFGWIYRAIRGILAPMMYQSVVLGQRTVGQGIAEGWTLVRAHFWPMVIFWLLTFAVSMGFSMVMQVFIVPLNMVSMRAMSLPMLSGPGAIPDAMSMTDWLLLGVGSLGMGFFTWISTSLLQTFTGTMYARVYRELTETAPAEFYPEDTPSSIITS